MNRQTNQHANIRLAVSGLLLAIAGLAAAGCSSMSQADDIVGNWQPSDGSNMKTILENGACSGMFYSGSQPLDIGGPMTCSFSENKDSGGWHTMVVSQPPNQKTIRLKFTDANTVEVADNAGNSLFTMTRS